MRRGPLVVLVLAVLAWGGLIAAASSAITVGELIRREAQRLPVCISDTLMSQAEFGHLICEGCER